MKIPYGESSLDVPRGAKALKPRSAKPPRSIFPKIPRARRLVVLVPDVTRKLDLAPILKRLPKPAEVVFALGIHRRHTSAEQAALLGPFAKWPHRDSGARGFVRVGKTSRGTPVEIDRGVMEADHVVAVTRVGLHYFAGFSGGRKMIIPGVSSPDTCRANHMLVLRGGSAIGKLAGNPVHEDMLEAAALAPPTTFINVVPGAGIYDFETACDVVRRRTEVKLRKPLDAVIVSCGGYPSDINFIQSHKALEYARAGVRPGGTIALAAECRDGIGHDDFLPWFDRGDAKAMGAALRRDYRIYRQTAWATRRKAETYRIQLLSRLPARDVERMGLEPIDRLPPGISAVVPLGASTWLHT